MPRAGDGSGDSGPYEAHEIIHGKDGDASLQHTQHVAPMPSQEAGDAIPGLNASGGGAAPSKGDAEEYYENNPASEDYTQSSTAGSKNTSSAGSKTTGTRSHDNQSQSKTQSQTQSQSQSQTQSHTQTQSQPKTSTSTSTSSSKQQSSHDSHSSHSGNTHQLSPEEERHLGQISREKAEKYVNLDEDNESSAAATSAGKTSGSQIHEKSQHSDTKRSHEQSQHSETKGSHDQGSDKNKPSYASAAGQAAGGKKSAEKDEHKEKDLHDLHGEAKSSGGGRDGNSSAKGGKSGRNSHEEDSEEHKFDQMQRDKAEKFGAVNLQGE